jgi:general secretion pathway protein J
VGDSGFTLLELIVALVVLGFVLAAIAGGFEFGLRAETMQSRRIAAHADLGATDRILRRLVAEMDPGTNSEPPQLTAGPSTLSFVSDLGRAAAGLGEDGSAQVGLGVDAGHHLVLRWSPAIHGIRLTPPPPVRTAVLLGEVERVEFAFWGRNPEGGAGVWLSGWTERALPPLVRIRLRFAPGSGRSWPDIIAPTERMPVGG